MKQRIATVVGLAMATVALAAQDTVQIDFRNYIPGVLDAPVFFPDGVTPLSDRGRWLRPSALLYFSKVTNDLSLATLVCDSRPFGGVTNAGYWQPELVTLPPDVRLGDHIWLFVRAWEYGGWFSDTHWIGRQGLSSPLALVVTNPVMTLAGLESFSLEAEHLESEVREGQFVISWWHSGASTYWLDRSEDLAATNSWVTVFTSTTEPFLSTISVTNALLAQPQFYRLRRSPLP